MSDTSPSAPRLLPDRPLPPWSYVPGRHPHPIRDEAGHSFGREVSVSDFHPDRWDACEEYLFGIDLFNAGFYWEAHEAWEAVWIAAGRTGTTADFLKGLIKLAATGVKAREGNANGVRRHAGRAAQLFGESGSREATLAGLSPAELQSFAVPLVEDPTRILNPADVPVLRVWDFELSPRKTT